jgi:hypothetical protein
MKLPGGCTYFPAAEDSGCGCWPGLVAGGAVWFCIPAMASAGLPRASAPEAPAVRRSCLRVSRESAKIREFLHAFAENAILAAVALLTSSLINVPSCTIETFHGSQTIGTP